MNPFDDIVKYSLVGGYMIAMVFEIFLPCYAGSVVCVKSQQLLGAVYRSNWIEQSRGFKSAVLIFGERVKQPIEPTAIGIFPLQLTTFVKVLLKLIITIGKECIIYTWFQTMKLTFSILAILQEME